MSTFVFRSAYACRVQKTRHSSPRVNAKAFQPCNDFEGLMSIDGEIKSVIAAGQVRVNRKVGAQKRKQIVRGM